MGLSQEPVGLTPSRQHQNWVGSEDRPWEPQNHLREVGQDSLAWLCGSGPRPSCPPVPVVVTIPLTLSLPEFSGSPAPLPCYFSPSRCSGLWPVGLIAPRCPREILAQCGQSQAHLYLGVWPPDLLQALEPCNYSVLPSLQRTLPPALIPASRDKARQIRTSE